MLALEHLAQYQVSVAQARDFIIANLSTPETIFSTAVNFNITADMLAEIYGGVSASDVVGFFNNIGLNGDQLNTISTQNNLGAPFNTATNISIDDNVRANNEEGINGANWYDVDLTAGSPYTFSIDNTINSSNYLLSPLLEVYDSSGTIVTEVDTYKIVNSLNANFTPQSSGKYYLAVKSEGYANLELLKEFYTEAEYNGFLDGYLGDYRLSVEDNPLSPLQLGTTVNNDFFTEYDMDSYLVNLDAGVEYQFDMFATGIDATKLGTPSIQINHFDSFFEEFGHSIYDGSSSLSVTPNESGPYVITVGTYDAGIDTDYSLSFGLA